MVCKGCRVAHYAQEASIVDRPLIMARGARVLVCAECANIAVYGYRKTDCDDVDHKECVCDTRWTCFRCREDELERLARARAKYVEGNCGRCENVGDMKRHVDFCLHCRGWRVYAASTDEMGR